MGRAQTERRLASRLEPTIIQPAGQYLIGCCGFKANTILGCHLLRSTAARFDDASPPRQARRTFYASDGQTVGRILPQTALILPEALMHPGCRSRVHHSSLLAGAVQFVDEYKHRRPHHTEPPQQSSTPAAPATRIDTHNRVRTDRADQAGAVTLRVNGRLHHIGIGRHHCRIAC